MTNQIKIYICLAAVFAFALAGGFAWSHFKIKSLENAVDAAKREALIKENEADAKELQAAEYKQKTEYLEKSLGEIQVLARKQDDEIEKINNSVADARSDVSRASRVRSIAATAGELCTKLAELGHPCE